MNKKGFTITELLAVVVILGILTSIASVGVTRYRQKVREKELVNLHSTIETGFDDYRSKIILSGGSSPTELNLCEGGVLQFDITYGGNKLKCGTGNDDVNIKKAKITTKIKGEILQNDTLKQKYETDKNITTNEQRAEYYKKDGICMIESEEPIDGSTLSTKCIGNNPEEYLPSKEEIICIELETEREELINDFKDGNSMCWHWRPQ